VIGASRARASRIVGKCSSLHIHLYMDFYVLGAPHVHFVFLCVGSYVTGAPDTRARRKVVTCMRPSVYEGVSY
jgi:hypothetical protein